MLKITMTIAWLVTGTVVFFLVWMVGALICLKLYFSRIPPGQRTLIIGRWFG